MPQTTTASPKTLILKHEPRTHRRRAICRRCDGTGQVEHTNYPEDGYTAHPCPMCKGSGMVQLTIKVFVEPATVSAI